MNKCIWKFDNQSEDWVTSCGTHQFIEDFSFENNPYELGICYYCKGKIEVGDKEEDGDRFFEVKEPYYALIKAKDVEELKDLYESNIAENIELDSIEEVTEAYANFRTGMAIALELIRLEVSHDDIMNTAVKEAYEFVKKENILLVDGSLM